MLPPDGLGNFGVCRTTWREGADVEQGIQMIKRETSTRRTKCRSCDQFIPANTESYYVACVGNNSTNVFVCKDCVYYLINDVAADFDNFESLGEFITMKKLEQ